MVSVNERIAQLRKLMHQKKIDVYYVPNEDDHLSEEYTAEYFQCKSFLSGFTGDAGCLIVTKNFAGLWTDGRYFTQAEGELAGTEVTLMRLRQAGVPDPLDYLIAHTPKNGVLGFDGRVVSAAVARKLADALSAKNAKLHMSDDLAGLVWGNERPAMPEEKLFVLPEKYTGESAAERIGRVREAMKAQKADVLVLTELEDPCWMLNVRGNDIACTPVAYAFAIVTRTKVYYYVDLVKVPAAVKKHLEKAGVGRSQEESHMGRSEPAECIVLCEAGCVGYRAERTFADPDVPGSEESGRSAQYAECPCERWRGDGALHLLAERECRKDSDG